jgi:hypothetical protein
VAAKEAAHLPRDMAMIDAQGPFRYPLAELACAALASKHCVEFLHGNPIDSFQSFLVLAFPLNSAVFFIGFGILPPFAAPLGCDFFFVRPLLSTT